MLSLTKQRLKKSGSFLHCGKIWWVITLQPSPPNLRKVTSINCSSICLSTDFMCVCVSYIHLSISQSVCMHVYNKYGCKNASIECGYELTWYRSRTLRLACWGWIRARHPKSCPWWPSGCFRVAFRIPLPTCQPQHMLASDNIGRHLTWKFPKESPKVRREGLQFSLRSRVTLRMNCS